MTLDPQVKIFVDQLTATGIPPDFAAIGAVAAQELVASRPMPGEGPQVARVENLEIRGRNGTMPARLYVPDQPPCGLLVYLHGGGWVLGNISGYDPPLRHFANRAGCAILSVEYRLAPQHRFPAAIEDSYDAVRWAAENLTALKLNADLPVAVGGDSAGGNLSAVVSLLARDIGTPLLAAQLLLYPATDADFTTPSYLAHTSGLPLTSDSMRWFWDQYVPVPAERLHPHASPLRAEDLSHLPAALVVLAGYDPLLSEGESYSAKLMSANVPVTELRYDGLIHGFFQFSELLPVAGEALEEIADTFRTILLTGR